MTKRVPATARPSVHRIPLASGVTTGKSQARAAPSARTSTTYSGINPTDSSQSARSQRPHHVEPSGKLAPAGTARSPASPSPSEPTIHFARYATPNTSSSATARRRPTQRQPSTSPMNAIVAGLRMGLPSQNASDAPVEHPLLLSPSATGAAQHVHIISGTDVNPARA